MGGNPPGEAPAGSDLVAMARTGVAAEHGGHPTSRRLPHREPAMSLLESLLSLLTDPRPAARRGRRAPDWADAPAAAAPAPDAERPLGCGWFDSSHDLERGLLVREHASPDAVAAQLPLGFWLQLHLADSSRGLPRG